MSAKKAATSAKHKTTTVKHAATKKHTSTESAKTRSAAAKKAAATKKAAKAKVTTKAKTATHATAAKAVSFGAGDWLPVCAFEAVAQSLRLAGQPVSDDEVAWLWELCGARPATTVEDALAAAARFGLAGFRPVGVHLLDEPSLPFGQRLHIEDVDLGEVDDGLGERLFHGLLPFGLAGTWPTACDLPGPRRHGRIFEHGDAEDLARTLGVQPVPVLSGAGVHGFEVPFDEGVQQVFGHGLILGVDVPGPHAVLATRDGWWSWGERYDPWPCNVAEAWAVSWS